MAGIDDFYRGDTLRFKLTLKDAEGNPIDITGSTIWFTMKEAVEDDDSQAAIQISTTNHSDPINGITEIIIPASETTNLRANFVYYYDFQLVDSSGNVKTLLAGEVKVLPDITRRTS